MPSCAAKRSCASKKWVPTCTSKCWFSRRRRHFCVFVSRHSRFQSINQCISSSSHTCDYIILHGIKTLSLCLCVSNCRRGFWGGWWGYKFVVVLGRWWRTKTSRSTITGRWRLLRVIRSSGCRNCPRGGGRMTCCFCQTSLFWWVHMRIQKLAQELLRRIWNLLWGR